MNRRATTRSSDTTHEKDVAELKSALWQTRHDLISIGGYEAERILSSYASRMTTSDNDYENTRSGMVARWMLSIVDEILGLVKPEDLIQSTQALCPLCRGSSQAPYAIGFAFPEGLRRHLLGTFNSHRCVVVNAAVAIAKDHVEER